MDSIFIFGLMLVLFGPKKLPEIARQAGKLMMEFRRASNDFKLQMEEELRSAEQADRQKKIDAENEAQRAIAASTTTTTLPDGGIAQLSLTDEATGDATSNQEAVPTILPPSVGETVSTAPPNRYRVEREEATTGQVIPVPPVETGQTSAAEFYGEESTAPPLPPQPTSAASETVIPAAPVNGASAATFTSAPETTQAAAPPATGSYPDNASMAESDQAPIHHG